MTDPATPPGPGEQPPVADTLRAIAEVLRDAGHLGPTAQREIADTIEELSRTLGEAGIEPARAAALAEHVRHLGDLVNRRESVTETQPARDRLTMAIAAVEAESPFVAGVARRLIDLLSSLGI